MNAGSFDHLRLPAGAEPTMRHLQQLADHVSRQDKLLGPGIHRRKLPWGTHLSARPRGGAGYVSPYFLPSVSVHEKAIAVTWQKGVFTAAGLTKEPTIQGTLISDPKAVFEITPDVFQDRSTVNVYFQLIFASDWSFLAAEPIASAADLPTANAPFSALRLSCIVGEDGSLRFRQLIFNQALLSLNPTAGGYAQHIFYADV